MTGFWRAGAEGMTGWTSNPGQYFDGTLDELAVYPTASSPPPRSASTSTAAGH